MYLLYSIVSLMRAAETILSKKKKVVLHFYLKIELKSNFSISNKIQNKKRLWSIFNILGAKEKRITGKFSCSPFPSKHQNEIWPKKKTPK